MLPLTSVNQRLALWQSPRSSSGADVSGPVDSFLARQREETEARSQLQGLPLLQKLHGNARGLAAEMGRLTLAILDEPFYDTHYLPRDREAIVKALGEAPPDPSLIRRTVHLAQVLEARSQDMDVDPEVRKATDDAGFARDLKARLGLWGKQAPPVGALASLARSLARVTSSGEVLAPPSGKLSTELKKLLSSKEPEEFLKSAPQATSLLFELVAPGPWMSEKSSDLLYNLICSRDPEVRERLEPVLDQVEQIGTATREAGLDRPPASSDWAGALLSAIKLRHPERIDAGLLSEIAVFVNSPSSNAAFRAFDDLKQACREKPELWSYAAHEVLRAAREEGPVPGTFSFLTEAKQAGWEPSSEQLSQCTGQTLAALATLRDGLMRETDLYRAANEGLRFLQAVPGNPYPWQSVAAEMAFRGNGWQTLWVDNLAPLAERYGRDRLLSELRQAGAKRVDDLPTGLQNAIRALADDPGLQAVLEPMLPRGCATRALEDIVEKAAANYQTRATPETLVTHLQVEQAFDRRRTFEPDDGEWEKLIHRWAQTSAPEPLTEIPAGFLDPASDADLCYQKTLDLVRLKAPPGQMPGAILLMGDFLRSEGAPFPAWVKFCQAADRGDLLAEVRDRLGVGQRPEPAAGVAFRGDSVTVGPVSLRVRKRDG